jgi:tRNA (guanine9-N1)-methyltransferase
MQALHACVCSRLSISHHLCVIQCVLCRIDGPVAAATLRQYPDYERWHSQCHAQPLDQAFEDHSKMVYLTADAEAEVSTLEAGHSYVIGGIVDRNRHKNICLDKAKRLGMHAARLPISEHLAVAGSKVLTVNQVVDLLLQYRVKENWQAACDAVVPVRKKQCANESQSPTAV